MISRRTSRIVAAVTLAVVIGVLYWRPDATEAGRRDRGLPAPSAPGSVAASRPDQKPGASPAVLAAADPNRSELADTLNSPAQDIRADLRVVGQILDVYRTNFPHDGNPTGNNAEITAVLAGNNLYHVAFIPRDHPAINARGELCDRWGQPFFFHTLSGTKMEIRSAGPDGRLWTADDAVLAP